MTTHPAASSNSLPFVIPFALEWILLCGPCEDLVSYEEWVARREAAHSEADAWTVQERTDFWYSVADVALKDVRLAPTPGLVMTAEAYAEEMHRLTRLVHDIARDEDGDVVWDWMLYTDPTLNSFTEHEVLRYATRMTTLVYPDYTPPSISSTAAATGSITGDSVAAWSTTKMLQSSVEASPHADRVRVCGHRHASRLYALGCASAGAIAIALDARVSGDDARARHYGSLAELALAPLGDIDDPELLRDFIAGAASSVEGSLRALGVPPS